MCGIAGLFSKSSEVRPEMVRLMTNAIRHRGPDDEGLLAIDTVKNVEYPLVSKESKIVGHSFETFGNSSDLVLGHRRLSIIDVSPFGHQPMVDSCGKYWIVFNGEIYNYLELKEELKYDYKFITNTDTEVILAAFKIWGESCVNRFNGMWSFVIYDKENKRLFGSRDRFGVKPFYYINTKDFFAFASEIKGIIALPFIEKSINTSAVFDYLSMGFEEQEEEGFFKGVLELRPSMCFSYDLKNFNLKKWRYFSLSYNDQLGQYDDHIAAKHISCIRELVLNAVRLRLRSDVPLGSCLSGGIDSSSIVCTINQIIDDQSFSQVGDLQRVFTASYHNPSIDESRWAEIVAKRTRSEWHRCFPVADELLADIEDLVFIQDVPFGSTSIYAQYRVMKLAAEKGVKVILDGQGGDELFSGYAPYYRTYFAEIFKNLDFKVFLKEWRNINNSPTNCQSLGLSLLKLALLKHLPAQFKELLHYKFSRKKNLISPEFWDAHKERMAASAQSELTSLNEMLHFHMTGANLKVLLKYEDRNSMRFSMEARTPFADDIDLIKYLFNVPSIYKIHQGWSKDLLRKSMAGIIPDAIRIRRDKIGFVTPESNWINHLKKHYHEYLTKDLESIVNVKKLKNSLDSNIKTQSPSCVADLWKIINLSVWMKVYRVSL